MTYSGEFIKEISSKIKTAEKEARELAESEKDLSKRESLLQDADKLNKAYAKLLAENS
jgi:cell division protein FtsL